MRAVQNESRCRVPVGQEVCMAPAGTTHAQTASSAEGVSPCRNWMLSRTEVEVRRGADLSKFPQERGGTCRSKTSDPALLTFMRAQASAEINVRGEPMSRRASRP